MSDLKIKKGSPKFLMAMDNIAEVQRWWTEHPIDAGVAFVGRSNVGKSSLINSLFGAKTAKTSKTPGRTQKINVFSFILENDPEERTFYLYDLPGYGHAQVSKAMGRNWIEIMSQFFVDMNDNSAIINIQDARHPDQKSDKAFYEYINAESVPIFLIFNKIDKLKKQKERAALNKQKPALFANYTSVKEIHFVSAEKKDGLDKFERSCVDFLLEKNPVANPS